MRILDWFRRLFRRKKEVEAEPIEERAERFEGVSSMPDPRLTSLEAFEESVLDYIADMLSDRTLIPSYLRKEMAAARKLPAEAWDWARVREELCDQGGLFRHVHIGFRAAALEHARRVALAVSRRGDSWL